MFPFLIGTVRTRERDDPSPGEREFPFLIGTVRTIFLRCLYRRTIKFPFLIGTVRTKEYQDGEGGREMRFHSS